jgi:hypothetical protein
MKEEAKKEQMKQIPTFDPRLNVSRDAGWARCPTCKEIWRIWCFEYPWYAVRDVEHHGLPSEPVSERFCPIHTEEIIVDGRAKGKRTILNQDQLKEMSEYGLHCPACEEGALEKDSFEGYCWTCRRCRASVVIEQVVTSDGRIEVKYCSFRKDLGKRNSIPLFPVPYGYLDFDSYTLEKM